MSPPLTGETTTTTTSQPLPSSPLRTTLSLLTTPDPDTIDSPDDIRRIDGSSSTSYNDNDDTDGGKKRGKRANAATGASAAGVRALSAQALAFWFRAPAKAFIPSRIDYMALAKAISPRIGEDVWSWHKTTPGLLTHAVRTHGWRFIPDQVMPPLLANVFAGAVLYTTYLQTLSALHEPTHQARAYPPPSSLHTFTAGFSAGFIQSIVAAPLDALQVRFKTHEVLDGHYENMWHYGRNKLREIGLRGIFSGWSLMMAKDSLGAASFFASFETVKGQAYYAFVGRYYGSLNAPGVQRKVERASALTQSGKEGEVTPVIHPHYAIEPAFLLMAGITASLTSQFIHYPLGIIQDVYYERLDRLDRQARHGHSSWRKMMRFHQEAYRELKTRCAFRAVQTGGWRRFLFQGFWGNVVKSVPSTSAGLIIFELVRRRQGSEGEPILIRNEGYDVLLV